MIENSQPSAARSLVNKHVFIRFPEFIDSDCEDVETCGWLVDREAEFGRVLTHDAMVVSCELIECICVHLFWCSLFTGENVRMFREMPRVVTKAAIAVNWDAIKMMFATGKTCAEISEALHIPEGTIRARSSRNNWIIDRKAVQRVAADAAASSQAVMLTMYEKGKLWPSRVATIAEKGLSVLEREEPATLSQVDRLTSVLDKVDKVGRRSHGLDEDSAKGNTIVNLGFLSGYAEDPLKTATVINS